MARPRNWDEGTEWAMIGLPASVAAKLRTKYGGSLPEAVIDCLQEKTAELEWPPKKEGGASPRKAPEQK